MSATAEATSPPVSIAQWPYEFAVTDTEAIFVDATYQRKLSEEWVNKRTGDNFRPALVGCVVLSDRGGRKKQRFACFDGQHRLALVAAMDIRRIPSIIYQDLSPAQEAELFADLQTERRGMHPYMRFAAQLVAGNDRAVEIDAIARRQQFTVSDQKGPYTMTAVAALEKVWAWGPDILEATLWVIAEAYRGEVPPGAAIRAIGYFLDEQGLEAVDQGRLAQRLGTLGIAGLQKRAVGTRDARGGEGGTISVLDFLSIVEATYSRQGGRNAK